METSLRVFQINLTEASAKGPPPAGNLGVPIFTQGPLEVELYQPIERDPQQPHTRDELYFVVRGTGRFFDGEESRSVAAGSFVFVPARQVHRFEDFSSDFAVWVVFYGPEGGSHRHDG